MSENPLPGLLTIARRALELRLVAMRLDAQARASAAAGGVVTLVLAAALLVLAAGFAALAAYAALLASGASQAMAAALVALGILVLALLLGFVGQRSLARSVRPL